jgi:RNA polymerase sigma factor (sigma-70 family)
MRRGFIILALGFIGAIAAYYGLYRLGTATPRTWLRSQQPELAWLKHEFSLSDAEFARISQLHEGYLPQCKERCRHIEELNNALMKAIGALPEELRLPLILAEYEGRSQAEIGEILGCSVKAVETRIYRARQRLRVGLGKLMDTV